MKFLEVNGYRYEKGLIIVKDDILFEIDLILSCEDKFYFILMSWNSENINKILHSIKIVNKSEFRRIVDFDDIQTKRPFEKIYFKGESYVPAITLDLPFV